MKLSLREELRAHQAATDCSDSKMLDILCGWVQDFTDHDPDERRYVIDYVVNELQQGPPRQGELIADIETIRAYDLPMFTDEDKKTIFTMVEDELSSESIKDRVWDYIETMETLECICYACEDTQAMADMLIHIDQEPTVTGEFLRLHDDEDNYPTMIDFAVRMGLLNDEETGVTDLGREFIDSVS